MLISRPYLYGALGAVTFASSLILVSGCKPKSTAESADGSRVAASATEPEPFTGTLTEIQGVQGIYTLRHPKLILAELDKLMTAVPEASMARMFFGGLTPYGYPEFSEIAAGSNIGIAILEITPEELEAQKPTVVAFVKLKEGGKIWTALTKAGLALKKDGEWTWIAQNAAAFAKVTAPAPVYAHIEQAQTEELRAWGRLSPALFEAAKTPVFEKLKTSLASRPADEQTAFLAYADVAWKYLAQLHSAGGSLDLNDDGITFAYFGQFTPDSATGRYLRYPAGPAPKIASSVPSDGVFSAILRQNMAGQVEYINGMFDALIAVNYPEGSEALKAAKTGFHAFAKGSDGSGVFTMNMTMPKGDHAPEISMIGVNPGSYTEADVLTGYKTTLDLSKRFTNAIIASASSFAPGTPVPSITTELTENAFEIDGTRFGSILTTTAVKGTDGAEDQVEKTTQYFGVVGGTLVYGSDEAALRAKLPAIARKQAVANPVDLAFAPGEMLVGVIHGERIVDMTVAGIQLDTTDADVRAQLDGFRQGFAAAGPIKLTVTAQQAKGAVELTIPYSFIAQGVRLGQFAAAYSAQAAAAAAGSPAGADAMTEQP